VTRAKCPSADMIAEGNPLKAPLISIQKAQIWQRNYPFDAGWRGDFLTNSPMVWCRMDGLHPIENTPLAPGQIRFRMHAPDIDQGDNALSAEVFARKVLNLVQALAAADGSVNNGKRRHDFVISKLQSSSPTATFEERTLDWKRPRMDTQSAVLAFSRCASAIVEGKAAIARKYGKCAEFIAQLGTGAKKKFEYAELWVGEQQVYRVDSFLHERAIAVLDTTANDEVHDEDDGLFSGVAFGSFDGTVQVADLRGSLPAIKLILSAGQKQIDCVCRAGDIEMIRDALNRRVRVFGRAIYDGRSPLPRRIEVADIEPVAVDADFSKWKSSFDPFEISDWQDDTA
jgi:hypothetical protein